MTKFHQRILKIFSANAVSIEPSFLRQFCWDSDQNSFDSPNSRLSPIIYVCVQIRKFLIAENFTESSQPKTDRVCHDHNSQTDRVWLTTDRVPTSTRPVFSVLHLMSLEPLAHPLVSFRIVTGTPPPWKDSLRCNAFIHLRIFHAGVFYCWPRPQAPTSTMDVQTSHEKNTLRPTKTDRVLHWTGRVFNILVCKDRPVFLHTRPVIFSASFWPVFSKATSNQNQWEKKILLSKSTMLFHLRWLSELYIASIKK